jgi:hypothetical protein
MDGKPTKKTVAEKVAAKPTLLTGGNPQIAKADGHAPVRAYIAAMPGWKRAIGKQLDALIVRTVLDVRKAVKWNSPFYGIDGQGWFLSFHVFTHYVKVTFFRGTSLRPLPPGASKHKDVRYIDIHEDDLDEAQMAAWVKQAAALPGWVSGQSDKQEENLMSKVKAKPKAKGTSRAAGASDWREETLARMRALILEADPEMIEERKWKKPSNAMAGVPVWSHDGIVCTGETYRNAVKLTFALGAKIPDPSGLFNSSLEGNTRRAIDIHEGEKVDARAFKALVKAAVAQNGPAAKKRRDGKND